MATNTVGIDKEVEVNRKENLRDHRLYWIGRRTQDIILSSVALVVLSPVMLATAIAIVLDDPSAGPVFSQERIGRNGKPFKFYKFRSMCPNEEAKLDDLLDQGSSDRLRARVDAVLSSMACHGSVRSGRRMTAEEIVRPHASITQICVARSAAENGPGPLRALRKGVRAPSTI